MTFEGRVALVTGSTRGIGWAVARQLAARGATVVLNGSRDQAALDDRVQELRDGGAAGPSAVLCDVAQPAAVAEAVRGIFRRHRRLDVLVNNAGVLDDALLGMIGEASAERVFAVNALGTLHVMQAAARLIARGGGGAIVNVASIVGVHGNAGQAAYGGSKAAVIGMTRAAAKELARANVRVNAVAPGFIDTDMIRHLTPETQRERVASVAMGRVGQPEEVARAIVWLASDEASYVTGQVLGVDGGMVI